MKNKTPKNFKSKIISKLAIIFFTIVFLAINPFPKDVSAQPLLPEQHGSSENSPPGGGAPIGSGLLIFSLMGIGYASLKVKGTKKKTCKLM